MKIWYCKIGEAAPSELSDGSDKPMRDAICKAYEQLVGAPPEFLFSGWGANLTFGERLVVENVDRRPSKHEIMEQIERTKDELVSLMGMLEEFE